MGVVVVALVGPGLALDGSSSLSTYSEIEISEGVYGTLHASSTTLLEGVDRGEKSSMLIGIRDLDLLEKGIAVLGRTGSGDRVQTRRKLADLHL